ncbi:HET-domain-containing protein [Lentinus tigrinus ALCF2SS1-7]|uniref:HET-domain-containing protein n=1 Tax=Lentinus tigrinus ALCF2SS1-6 TaxID=1328759 RepID=A0A5C2S3E5_9APHY|nr:HET-domain-containing protein [Lentinus tigrinus ALCF2SS1-6]RPD70462.1 HET-domain-containing protein [Lentinus tigrinus ALCF2SS1-7]
MWLLSTDRAELHFFASPQDVEGGYAILSHVWDKNEQTFQDLQTLQRHCAKSRKNPRDLACKKIRRCCELAEQHGFRWVWIDTCCIDKTSSAELSEAINSMFRYYALSRVCYAYLKDVLTHVSFPPRRFPPLVNPLYALKMSKWHTRGWTLQELIAPRLVIFLSNTWEPLGSKADLANEVEEATGVPAGLLRLEQSLSDFSIAQRMSWAAGRQTTRVEDEAYSLLGIFDLHMPTLYGEGRNAFQRLQEEILRRNQDTTLFAWGEFWELEDLPDYRSDPDTRSRLFASSPADFRACRTLTYKPREGSQNRRFLPFLNRTASAGTSKGAMTFSLTPHGVLAHLPIVTIRGRIYADLSWSTSSVTYGHTPLWRWEGVARILLILRPYSHNPDRSRPSYTVGYRYFGDKHRRLVAPPEDVFRKRGKTQWKDVYLIHGPPDSGDLSRDRPDPLIDIPFNRHLNPPFRFPPENLQSFVNSLGTLPVSHPTIEISVENAGRAWHARPGPTTFTFSRPKSLHYPPLVIAVGWCPFGRSLWAKACAMTEGATYHDHSCQDGDHVSDWAGPNKTKTFEVYRKELWLGMLPGYRTIAVAITLSFTPCRLNPRTLILHASAATMQLMPKRPRTKDPPPVPRKLYDDPLQRSRASTASESLDYARRPLRLPRDPRHFE